MARQSLSLADKIDFLGLGLIGFYALGCVLGQGSGFSEIHLFISGLPFPIFIGEMVMAVGLFLLYLRSRAKPIVFNYWQQALWVYWVLVVVLVLWDFAHWGSLALRNGAMYYYIIFTLLAASFYNPRFFSQPMCVIISLVLVYLTSVFFEAQYYLWTCIVLFVFLATCIKSFRWRVVLFILFLVFFDYHRLFAGSRTNLFGTLGAGLFLTFVYVKYFVRHHFAKWAVIVVAISVCLGGVVFLADKNGVKSCLRIESMFHLYEDWKDNISKNKATYVPSKLEVALYNDNFNDSESHQTNEGSLVTVQAIQYRGQILIVIFSFVMLYFLLKPLKSHKLLAGIGLLVAAGLLFYLRSLPQQVAEAPDVKRTHVVEDSSSVTMVSSSVDTLSHVPMTPSTPSVYRSLDTAEGNAVFRIYIWKDMMEDLINRKAWLGIGLGEPQRSPSIEILNLASTVWRRDGWITPHNFFLHVIYRLGVVGLALIVVLIFSLVHVVRKFIELNSWQGIVLVSAIIYWLVASTFLVILELPHYAIPFWCLAGMILGYLTKMEEKKGVSA